MYDRIEFIVPAYPRGQGRPRFTSRGKHGRAYKDKKDEEWEAMIATYFLQEAGGARPHPDPVHLKVIAQYQPPQSWSKKRKDNPGPKLTKPDLDNVVKSVKDALKEKAWDDDCQVVELDASKRYGECDLLIVEVIRL